MAERQGESKCSAACYTLAVDRHRPCPLTLSPMGMTRLSGMDALRRMARIVTILVTVAWLLPALLTMLPSSASAAEQALYADLMKSRCLDMDGDGLPDGGAPDHDCNDCCLMCAAPKCGVLRVPVLVPIRFVPRPGVAVPEPELVLALPPSQAVFRPLSQRGPPA